MRPPFLYDLGTKKAGKDPYIQPCSGLPRERPSWVKPSLPAKSAMSLEKLAPEPSQVALNSPSQLYAHARCETAKQYLFPQAIWATNLKGLWVARRRRITKSSTATPCCQNASR